MKNKKQILALLSLVSAVALVTSLSASLFQNRQLAADVMGAAECGGFPDISQSSSECSVTAFMKEKAIFMGDSSTGNFRPHSPITRAEAVKVISQALYPEEVKTYLKYTYSRYTLKFHDLPDGINIWYFPYLKLATEKGIIKGHTDGTFRPDSNLNRAEFARIINTATGNQTDTSVAEGSAWYSLDIAYLEKLNSLFGGQGFLDSCNGQDCPSKNITRFEVAGALFTILNGTTESAGRTVTSAITEENCKNIRNLSDMTATLSTLNVSRTILIRCENLYPEIWHGSTSTDTEADTDTDEDTSTEDTSDSSEGSTEVSEEPSHATLSVRLASVPSSQTYASGTSNASLAGFIFFSEDADATLQSFSIQGYMDTNGDDIYGTGSESRMYLKDIVNTLGLYDGDTLVSDLESVNTIDGQIVFNNLDIDITEGTEKTLVLKGKISNTAPSDGTTDRIKFALASRAHVTALNEDGTSIALRNIHVDGLNGSRNTGVVVMTITPSDSTGTTTPTTSSGNFTTSVSSNLVTLKKGGPAVTVKITVNRSQGFTASAASLAQSTILHSGASAAQVSATFVPEGENTLLATFQAAATAPTLTSSNWPVYTTWSYDGGQIKRGVALYFTITD